MKFRKCDETKRKSLRWLDRCIAAHSRPDKQSAEEIIKRNCSGYAAGGKDKDHFWRMVTLSIEYSMGVRFVVD
ncbi:unnamed protein product [Adineta steineri]|uniref:Uncharacterized protein n=1 Tax=Adineta steineri TaxID=433720 RepID=A0A820ED09_9BILA|nr:unnamed protein product [Adineta steineri]